jgi:Mn2+/Fe2+ NRAMP family transporter
MEIRSREDVKERSGPPAFDQTELENLREVNQRPWPGRLLGYAALSGPGWIQGAMTLGASTATSSFYLGWKFGYEMLWVNVLGMLMGVIMFAAIARPALLREESIYAAMRDHVNSSLAVIWALAAAVTSAFWAMNQYSVATACLADLVQLGGGASTPEGLAFTKWAFGLLILAVSIPLTWAYGNRKHRGVRLYEKILKGIIFLMVLCLATVAYRTGIRWMELFGGLIPTHFPSDPGDRTMVLGALGCAVGINMTFLFPVSLRARGWGRDHLGLARFDLLGGMLLPFALVSSLVVITTANVLHGSAASPDDPAVVAKVMTPLFEGSWLPGATGRVLFDLGVAAMPLSTITILMLISGLAVCEVFRRPHRGLLFKLGTLLPAAGIFGVAYRAPFWLGPLISSFALILLPIAYLGYLVLCNRKTLLGKDLITGPRRWLWNLAMVIVLSIAVVGASLKVKDSLSALF